MNSLARVFSNFKEFYNDINAATLTGAIDVIVVEQPDGEFHCSPFHVRFGKLGVLRSREKVVDIEINGAPVDIQMKLGDSGEAFFVEECPESESDELPENLATSPIPKSFFPNDSVKAENAHINATASEKAKNASDELQLALPLPRRNSIDFSKDAPKEADADGKKFENQVSDYSHRRHTDNTLERSTLRERVKEYTTQKIRQEWAEHEEVFQFDAVSKEKDWSNSTQSERVQKETAAPATTEVEITLDLAQTTMPMDIPSNGNNASKDENNLAANVTTANQMKDESKSKTKKRRKKSQMKKKNSQRKTSSSSSVGSTVIGDGNGGDGVTAAATISSPISDEPDTQSATISNATNSSSNNEYTPLSGEQASAALITANGGDESPLSSGTGGTLPHTPSTQCMHDLDIHFFSDTEITTPTSTGAGGAGVRGAGRPSTPIQSDSELETTLREKHHDADKNAASWKWGELPTPELAKESARNLDNLKTERQSMLSNMFSFMKKANNIRKQANEATDIYLSDLDTGNLDPEMVALYFPSPLLKEAIKSADEESGNGTSLPHSPSSLEGQKSIDSDYDDSKQQDHNYPEFGALSLCGMNENGETSDEEFDRHIINFADVCKNPSLFSSPNLVVRLGGKYYTWTTACPIVMSIIIFQKPLTDEAVKQIMSGHPGEDNDKMIDDEHKESMESVDGNPSTPANADAAQTKRSWWNWRRSQGSNVGNADIKIVKTDEKGDDEKDGDLTAVATQTSRPATPDVSEKTFSKTDSIMNAENTSALVDNMEDLSMSSNKSDEPKERYKKSLRLSSSAIKKLNLKEGMNEIEFSVTTAYQGTTRCKCYLFRWRHNDKVVISDIDGTITKSDVLGHILPMVGKDWAQLGVAQLFSKIEQNGYKLLYLSARAIGQSRVTREYLRSIRQGNVMLPEGPLLLNPTSLISAFHREVIEKKPEQFKIACLSDIRDLFPNKDPFYAGYGNRINDVWAYRAVGIPIMRIFTINTKGELKHELTQTFQSSGYINQSLEVDEYFPTLSLENDDDDFYLYDVLDDDEEVDELRFSDSEPNCGDVDSNEDDGDAIGDTIHKERNEIDNISYKVSLTNQLCT